MTESIKSFVINYIGKRGPLPPSAQVDSFDFIGSGHVDSMGIIRFTAELESEFGVELTEDDIGSSEFRTIKGLTSLIARKLKPAVSLRFIGDSLEDLLKVDLEATKVSAAKTFMSSVMDGKRYLLGANEHAISVAAVVKIEAIIDDFTQETEFGGYRIVKRAGVPGDAIVVNCLTSNFAVTGANLTRSLGQKLSLNYSDLLHCFPNLIAQPAFVSETRKDIRENLGKWQSLFNALNDDISRKTLNDVVSFRLTADPRYMDGYSVRPQDQYFEDFMQLGSGEVFVDCGGFDGDTTEQFVKRHPGYKQVFFIEPSASNLTRAKKRLTKLENIQFIPKGISDSSGVLRFNEGAGSASGISELGGTEIIVTTIDDEIQQPVSFIKMDLEGWEIPSLKGAARHLVQDHPKLAIATYHRPSDFWGIFEYVRSQVPEYQTYLRHYTEGWAESVLFFAPPPRSLPNNNNI